ncbi:MAG: ZIP family metal transporter [Endomicrobiales bacterium]
MIFGNLLLFSFLAALSMLLGTLIVLWNEAWAQKNSVFLISFATGVMLSIAFINLIPASGRIYADTWLMVFAGFLALYVLQHVIMFHPCHDDACTSHLRLLSVIGLSLHSLMDGIAVAVGFEAGWPLGLLTTLAVLLHKIPDGITITGILVHSRTPRRKIFFLSLAVALCTPLGAFAAYLFLQGIAPRHLGMLLALTAGSFIYLAAADLLPETHRTRRQATPAFFFCGVGAVALLAFFLH